MAWGIMMTGLALFGMLGIAMHEVMTVDGPPKKPEAHPKVKDDAREIKKAA